MSRLKAPSPTVRRYVYGVAVAALPLLIAYGVLTEEHAPLWVAALGAVLVPGMAWANTPPPPAGGGGNE